MATKSKKSTKKATVKPVPKVKQYGGKNYYKNSCHTTKAAANKEAEKQRDNGFNVRVVEDKTTGNHCIMRRQKGR